MTHNSEYHYLFGRHAIEEAIKKDYPIQKIWIARERKSKLKTLIQEAKRRGLQIQYLPYDLFKKKFESRDALVAYVAPIRLWSLVNYFAEHSAFSYFALLENITDINNVGSIGRSAYALGCSALILSGKQIPLLTARAIEVSEGALLHLPVIREKSTLFVARFFKERGIRLYGTSERGTCRLFPSEIQMPHCWCFGNEQVGMSPLLMKQCDAVFAIPTRKDFPSLNVANAASICFYLSALANNFSFQNGT
jgi:23S rRNA (guanosine2251-2'-O)-methyltransferase